MNIELGFKEKDRSQAAALYANAFKRKFAHLIGSEEDVIALLVKGLDPERCFCYYKDDKLVGLAGFHKGKEGLVNITLSDFVSRFGLVKGLTKGFMSAIIFHRNPVSKNEILMDGIAVDEDHRGQGIGSQLFDALFEWTKSHDFEALHLDVIDENPKAKALYERLGFQKTAYEKVPRLIEKTIGVSGVTHMRKVISKTE